jgi:uncharacterized protein
MHKLLITAEDAGIAMTATLNDSETARKLLKILPTESHAQIWGEEVYFEVPLKLPEENAHAEVPSGTVAYWSPGHALCIFFGQEPYSPVNVVGTLDGDAKLFARVRSGDKMRVQLAHAAKKEETQPA